MIFPYILPGFDRQNEMITVIPDHLSDPVSAFEQSLSEIATPRMLSALLRWTESRAIVLQGSDTISASSPLLSQQSEELKSFLAFALLT